MYQFANGLQALRLRPASRRLITAAGLVLYCLMYASKGVVRGLPA